MHTTVSHAKRSARQRGPVRWGSVAVASAGVLTVECDEALSGPPTWQVTIESPAASFAFRIRDRATLEQVQSFLAAPRVGSEIKLGRSARLVADDELPGRIFVWLGTASARVRLALSETDARQVAQALTDVLTQWPS